MHHSEHGEKKSHKKMMTCIVQLLQYLLDLLATTWLLTKLIQTNTLSRNKRNSHRKRIEETENKSSGHNFLVLWSKYIVEEQINILMQKQINIDKCMVRLIIIYTNKKQEAALAHKCTCTWT
jgi:hypothetical protein